MSKIAKPNSLPALEKRFGEMQYRAPGALKAYAGNPRKHPEAQIQKLMASIAEFGFLAPVLIDESGTIVAGEARVEAAKRLGLVEVPVLIASHLSGSQVRAYRLTDNRLAELATWDEQALAIEIAAIIELDETPIELLGWETGEIDMIFEDAAEAAAAEASQADPIDEVPEPPKVPVTRPGDLWILGDHRLLCGSSLEAANWVHLMDGKVAAMVISDPPYNVPIQGHVSGLGKAQHREFAMASAEMSKDQFTDFLTRAIGLMSDHVKDGAIVDLFIDWRHIGEMQTALANCKLSLQNICIWKKDVPGMGSLYRSQHEMVFIAKKGKAPHTNNVELGKHGRMRSNVWSYPGATGFSKTRMEDLAAHPTVKNCDMIADAIRDVTHHGELVLDGFMGSGTAILAAERTMRIAYGIEIDPAYVDVAIQRWEAMTRGQAVLAGTGETFAALAKARAAEAAAKLAQEQTLDA